MKSKNGKGENRKSDLQKNNMRFNFRCLKKRYFVFNYFHIFTSYVQSLLESGGRTKG